MNQFITFYLSVLTCIALSAFSSCTNYSGTLKDIDRIMETNPEAAFVALERIKSDELDQSTYPYYCLLYTQAQIKNSIIVSSDSLIRIAYEIYGHQNNDDLKKRAYFYNALVLYNMGNLRDAMRDAIVTYDISKNEDDYYWIAKSAELMGDIFWEVYNYKQAEIYALETVENYRLANKIENHRYALCDLATTYLSENKNTEASILLDSLLNVILIEEPLDSALWDYVQTARYSVLFETNKYDQLEELSKNLNKDTSKEENFQFSIINSYVLNNNEDFEGASLLLSKAYDLADDDKHHIRILYATYKQALETKDYQKAACISDTLLIMQSRIAEDILRESVTSVQRDFYSSKVIYQQRKSKLMSYVLFSVIIITIILIILIVTIYRLKIRAKKAELESNISSLMYLKEQTEYTKSENSRLLVELNEKSIALEDLSHKLEDKSQIEQNHLNVIEYLFRQKWSTLNMLCNEYFEMGASEKTRIAILANIEKEIKNLRTKKNLKEIENAVNTYMGNIVVQLREECPFLKEDDYILLSLIFAGLSVRAICLLTNMKYKLFYLKKSRLMKRIAESTATHKETFLNRIK